MKIVFITYGNLPPQPKIESVILGTGALRSVTVPIKEADTYTENQKSMFIIGQYSKKQNLQKKLSKVLVCG